ncbi:MAG: intradiol ring-cleavage dioxygenase [Chloroflexi bacterium]|nr:intradiol ring-cleavage dioxygenase [Chloroflexota bacterium]MBP8059892.1 intradiol ring-cleavage dioxygenase [Chloroflexota bacterium]
MQGSAAATVGLLLTACGFNGDEEATTQVVQDAAANGSAPAVPTSAAAATPSTPVAESAAVTLPPTPPCGDDDDEPTIAQTEGPYYTPNTPERTSFWEEGTIGTRLVVSGRVLMTDCVPVAAALLDFWHADDGGEYDNVGYKFRGHQFTDANGNYTLETIMPGLYPGRTRHIHVKVQGPNMPVLTTQLYFPGEPQNASDGIFHPDLVMTLQDSADGKTGAFDFVLA